MTPACTDEAASAFNRSPPELVASVRHTVRFLFITAGIAAAATVNSHASASPAPRSKILLYVGFIAMELLLAWFIAVGVRARSYSVNRLLGKGWKSVSDGVRDIVLAVGFFSSFAVFLFCSSIWLAGGRPTQRSSFQTPSQKRSAGSLSQLPEDSARNSFIAGISNANSGASAAACRLRSCFKRLSSAPHIFIKAGDLRS